MSSPSVLFINIPLLYPSSFILPSLSLLLMRSNASNVAANRHVLVQRITVAQRPVVLVASVREMDGHAY